MSTSSSWGADIADLEQLVDGAERDHPGADELPAAVGKLEQLHPHGDALTRPAECLRRRPRTAPDEHRLDRPGLVVCPQVSASNILDCSVLSIVSASRTTTGISFRPY
jgi:hypothetical protein